MINISARNQLRLTILYPPFIITSGRKCGKYISGWRKSLYECSFKKAILIVSFGTSYENTRKRTIDAIERDIADAFPVCPVYRAWTSKMIIAKLKKRADHYTHRKRSHGTDASRWNY